MKETIIIFIIAILSSLMVASLGLPDDNGLGSTLYGSDTIVAPRLFNEQDVKKALKLALEYLEEFPDCGEIDLWSVQPIFRTPQAEMRARADALDRHEEYMKQLYRDIEFIKKVYENNF